jgi:hypothetical protein
MLETTLIACFWQLCILKTHISGNWTWKTRFYYPPKTYIFSCNQLGFKWLGIRVDVLCEHHATCSFCGIKFAPIWDYKATSCQHMYHFWSVTTPSVLWRVALKRCMDRLVGKFGNFKTLGEGGGSQETNEVTKIQIWTKTTSTPRSTQS